MKKSFSTMQLFAIAIAICLTYAYFVFTSKATVPDAPPRISSATSEAVTRRCAVEARIDPDRTDHKVTREEMEILSACTERELKRAMQSIR